MILDGNGYAVEGGIGVGPEEMTEIVQNITFVDVTADEVTAWTPRQCSPGPWTDERGRRRRAPRNRLLDSERSNGLPLEGRSNRSPGMSRREARRRVCSD